jgi:L-threonylcarbamoyladenylate synthase
VVNNRRILPFSNASLTQVCGALIKGDLVALPTETVYGLAANALDPHATRKIFDIKGRPLIDPLIVHVASTESVDALAYANPLFEQLAKHFWPGPLTLVLKKKECVPDLITAGNDTVALRCPKHPLFQSVLQHCKLPLAAPSANPFGYISPTRAEHVDRMFDKRLQYILDGGPCEHGVESTILDVSNSDSPTILRPGPITREILETFLQQPIKVRTHTAPTNTTESQLAPGSLEKHYSPHTPTYLLQEGEWLAHTFQENSALILFKHPHTKHLPQNCETFWLSESGTTHEAAQNLYHLLHTLDEKNYSALFIEKTPNTGLGQTLNDRIQRAAAKSKH